jgi:hypothetical protein
LTKKTGGGDRINFQNNNSNNNGSNGFAGNDDGNSKLQLNLNNSPVDFDEVFSIIILKFL